MCVTHNFRRSTQKSNHNNDQHHQRVIFIFAIPQQHTIRKHPSYYTTTIATITNTMRSNYNQSLTEQLLSVDAIDVVRVRSSDSTEPVHTTGKEAVATMPMTPPRATAASAVHQQQRSPAPATPTMTTPPRVPSQASPWRCKDDTASIFRSAAPSLLPPSILRSGGSAANTNVDFWSIQRSMAFDEDDAEF